MDTSPITSWEGAEAYFTFADKPGIMYAILAAAVIICFGTIVMAAIHETDAFKKIEGKE
jgi:uroporphyrinogen-III synthase